MLGFVVETRLAQDFAEDLVADGFGGFDRAATVADTAGLAENVFQAFARALARHFDQPERGNLADLGLGMILVEIFLQRPEHLALVILVLHVDEVDDDDTAEIAQPELAGNRLGGLHVGLEDRFLEILMPDEGAGIDVDRRHRLGLVDDEVTA